MKKESKARDAANGLTYSLLLLFLVLGSYALGRATDRLTSIPTWTAFALVGTGLVVTGALVHFESGLFNIGALTGKLRLIFSSIASMVALACGLAFIHFGRKPRLLIAVSAFLAAGALVAAAALMWKREAYTGRILLVLGIAASGSALGLLTLPRAEKPRLRAGISLTGVRLALAGLFAVAAACLVGSALFVRTSAEMAAVEGYDAVVPTGWVLFVAGGAALFAALANRATHSSVTRLVALGGLVVFGFTCVVAGSEQLLQHSAYVRALLAPHRPELQPLLGWWSVVLSALCLLGGAAWGFAGRKSQSGPSLHLPRGFRTAALLLAVVHLAVVAGLVKNAGNSVTSLGLISVAPGNGKIAWTSQLTQGPREWHRYNSPATPTPVVDITRNRICAYFGTYGLACVSTHGKMLWMRKDLPFESSYYGVGTSPIVSGSNVIVLSVSPKQIERPAFLIALDLASGKTTWRVELGKPGGNEGNNRTPLVLRSPVRDTVVIMDRDVLTGYDASSGGKLWKYSVPGVDLHSMVASPISDDETIYAPFVNELVALSIQKLEAGSDAVLWRCRCPGLNLSSPVLAEGLLFAVSDNGQVFCVDSQNGQLAWAKKLGGVFWSSPIVVDRHVYFTDRRGTITAFACGRTPEIAAEYKIGEPLVASLAVVGTDLVARTDRHLWCIRLTDIDAHPEKPADQTSAIETQSGIVSR